MDTINPHIEDNLRFKVVAEEQVCQSNRFQILILAGRYVCRKAKTRVDTSIHNLAYATAHVETN